MSCWINIAQVILTHTSQRHLIGQQSRVPLCKHCMPPATLWSIFEHRHKALHEHKQLSALTVKLWCDWHVGHFLSLLSLQWEAMGLNMNTIMLLFLEDIERELLFVFITICSTLVFSFSLFSCKSFVFGRISGWVNSVHRWNHEMWPKAPGKPGRTPC